MCEALRITNSLGLVLLTAILFVFNASSLASEIAILAPDSTATSQQYLSAYESNLEGKMQVVDRGLARAVLRAQNPPNPYNMTNLEARNLGAGIGCAYFVLLKSDTLRRTSLTRRKYFESYAAVFLVNARTGELINWHLKTFESEAPDQARSGLIRSASESAEVTGAAILKWGKEQKTKPSFSLRTGNRESRPDIRPPLPFRRIKPRYTKAANLYGIEATVDILVEIDKSGKITATRITRWAGFGLDESVEKTVREMNWRSADDRDGSFTMQVLLRYNFRDIDDSAG